MTRHLAPTTFVTITATMRDLIANVIGDLLLLLDEIDGDTDFEDGDDWEHDGREWEEGI